MARLNQPLLLVFALACLLAACTSPGPSTEIDIGLTDFQFVPNRFSVPAGAEITVSASHEGAVVHDLLIMDYSVDVSDKFEESDRVAVYWELKLEPNGTRTDTFIAPARPGTYQIVCGIPGHVQAGMIGELEVVAAE